MHWYPMSNGKPYTDLDFIALRLLNSPLPNLKKLDEYDNKLLRETGSMIRFHAIMMLESTEFFIVL